MDQYEIAELVRRVLEDRRDALLRLIYDRLIGATIMAQSVVKDNQYYPIKFGAGQDNAGVPGTLPADIEPFVSDNPQDFKIDPNPAAPGYYFVSRIGHTNANPDGTETCTISGRSASVPDLQVAPLVLSWEPDVATQVTVESAGDPQELPEPGPAAAIVISPASPTVAPGAIQQMTATVVDANQVPVDPQPPIAWSLTTNNSGGSIDDTGLYTAGTSGAADTIEASSGSLPAASDTITVS